MNIFDFLKSQLPQAQFIRLENKKKKEKKKPLPQKQKYLIAQGLGVWLYTFSAKESGSKIFE